MITQGMPEMTTVTTIRVTIGSKKPAGSIPSWRGEPLPTAKVIWKPLRSRPLVISRDFSASTIGRGAGTGRGAGPIIRTVCPWLSKGRPSNGVGQSDPKPPPDLLGERVGAHRPARVGDPPGKLGVA